MPHLVSRKYLPILKLCSFNAQRPGNALSPTETGRYLSVPELLSASSTIWRPSGGTHETCLQRHGGTQPAASLVLSVSAEGGERGYISLDPFVTGPSGLFR